MNIIPQPQGQKRCRRQTQCSYTLCGWLCTWTIKCCPLLCSPFKWDILLFILIKNHVFVFVPSTTAKWISSRNHRNRNGVGGKHNVLILYVNASAPNPSGVVLCNPFKWDISYSFLIKNHVVVFVPSTTAKWISTRNQRNRNGVGGKHNVLVHYLDTSAFDSSGVVLCNPFKWDILCSFLIKNLLIFACLP